MIMPAQTAHFCQFTQHATFVAPKYRQLSFLSPMFVVTSRHLSEITFLLRHHSVSISLLEQWHFAARLFLVYSILITVTHHGWWRTLTAALLPLLSLVSEWTERAVRVGCSESFWADCKLFWKKGDIVFTIEMLFTVPTVNINYFDCALLFSKMYSRFVNCPLLYFSGQSIEHNCFFINCFDN